MSTFGEELRREREMREISLRDVAESTKIGLRYLEAMERNDFGHLPGGVINRGFVRAYCQFIGVDPEAMVNAYLLEEQVQSRPTAAGDPGLLRRRAEGAKAAEAGKNGARALLWALVALVIVGVLAGAYLYIRLNNEEPQRREPTTNEGSGRRPAAEGSDALAAAGADWVQTVG